MLESRLSDFEKFKLKFRTDEEFKETARVLSGLGHPFGKAFFPEEEPYDWHDDLVNHLVGYLSNKQRVQLGLMYLEKCAIKYTEGTDCIDECISFIKTFLKTSECSFSEVVKYSHSAFAEASRLDEGNYVEEEKSPSHLVSYVAASAVLMLRPFEEKYLVTANSSERFEVLRYFSLRAAPDLFNVDWEKQAMAKVLLADIL